MKLYKISQSENSGYDTYDSAIVAARNEEEARNIDIDENNWAEKRFFNRCWASSPKHVIVEYIGTAKPGTKAGIILASFNAG